MLHDESRAGLAAGAGKADEGHLRGRITKEVAAAEGQAIAAVRHLHIGHLPRRNILAQHGGSPQLHGLGDEAVAVHRQALDGHEQIPGLHQAGVIANAGDLPLHIGGGGEDLQIFQYISELHIFSVPRFRIA